MTFNKYLIKFGKEIKKHRIDNDVSQEDLAEKSGLHTTYISRIENGKSNLTLEIIYKLSKALKIEIKDMFDFK